jgi:hypothetical protein
MQFLQHPFGINLDYKIKISLRGKNKLQVFENKMLRKRDDVNGGFGVPVPHKNTVVYTSYQY